jgi:hypothetical protein
LICSIHMLFSYVDGSATIETKNEFLRGPSASTISLMIVRVGLSSFRNWSFQSWEYQTSGLSAVDMTAGLSSSVVPIPRIKSYHIIYVYTSAVVPSYFHSSLFGAFLATLNSKQITIKNAAVQSMTPAIYKKITWWTLRSSCAWGCTRCIRWDSIPREVAWCLAVRRIDLVRLDLKCCILLRCAIYRYIIYKF